MKIILATIITFVLLAMSTVSLLATCMWGCPNTGIQLVFKITTSLLSIVFIYCLYLVWGYYKNRKTHDNKVKS